MLYATDKGPVLTTIQNTPPKEIEEFAARVRNETVFLDFQATTPIAPDVLEAMLPWMSGPWNAHSIEHRIGRTASDAVEEARDKVAALLGCERTEITFTSGSTEASNIVLRGVTRPGDELVISAIEHASVMETAFALEGDGRSIRCLEVNEDGILDIEAFQEALALNPALVSIMAVNNEIGTIQPIDEAAGLCAEFGVPFHSDLTQAAGRIPLKLTQSSVTYGSISSHKLYGPQGVGALFIRSGAEIPKPLAAGGGQENHLRPGTLPVANCVGFGVACELARVQRERDYEHAKNLSEVMLDGLAELGEWQVNGSLEERIPHNLSIAFENVDAEVLLASLPELALATGSACSGGSLKESETLKALGLSDDLAGGTVRIGFGRTTTVEEVQRAARMLCDKVCSIRRTIEWVRQ